MFAIKVDNLSKSFGKLKALDNISFEINKGEVFGLIGPDGAGKSTMFNILTTLMLPSSGTVKVLNYDIIKQYKKIRSKIGFLPGTFSLYPDLSVYENLRFFATMYGNKIDENLEIIAPIWTQISPFKDRQAGRLSGGMKQKLALCCALIHKPEILFLDEPTTGVDPVSRREFWEVLKTIKTFGVTVFVSTPYMDEATRCDRIALMQESKIITINTPQEIVNQYKGKLFSLHSKSLFQLLGIMEKCPLPCNYYPYGEYLHVSFYAPNFQLEQFTQFLTQNNQNFTELLQIDPIIEDCFIELVS